MLLPNTGSVCYFTFSPRFSKLDDIYIVQQTMPYLQAVEQNIDFITYLYSPVGLTKTDYSNDWRSYKEDDVLKLQKIDDSSVIVYAPTSILKGMPDPNVGCYNHYIIAIDVGYYASTDDFNWLIDDLNLMAADVTGTTATVQAGSIATKWMPVTDYKVYDATRKTHIRQIDNLYTQLIEQNRLILELKNKINYYEDTLKAINVAGG